MKTTATNKKIWELIQEIESKRLVPDPEFQRRLVWANKHKTLFIETIILGLPFPEIYTATGEVNLETGKGINWLVDGQQRLTTIYQYFKGDPEFHYYKNMVKPYAELSDPEKRAFLDYDVAVRDLGSIPKIEVITIFERINSTKYALNAMEINNARFDGAFIDFACDIANSEFFEKHNIFRKQEVKRMEDTKFSAILIVTIMSDYINRDKGIEKYFELYNDEFKEKNNIDLRIKTVFEFIENCCFPAESRVWNSTDLFTLIIELDRAINRNHIKLNPKSVAASLTRFYETIGSRTFEPNADSDYYRYWISSYNAPIDRSNRIKRGQVIYKFLVGAALDVGLFSDQK